MKDQNYLFCIYLLFYLAKTLPAYVSFKSDSLLKQIPSTKNNQLFGTLVTHVSLQLKKTTSYLEPLEYRSNSRRVLYARHHQRIIYRLFLIQTIVQ